MIQRIFLKFFFVLVLSLLYLIVCDCHKSNILTSVCGYAMKL
ncbi:MAG: hypothetical protein QG670_2831 [Thermoproteota archaeon]|nr:hypothetical protein [Thermoproteota archaeon]